MKRTKKLHLLLFCAIFSASAFAQTISLRGNLVSASNNESLPFATIAVANDSTPENIFRRFAADDRGNFFTELPAGTYVLTFHFVGMNDLQKTVKLTESQNPHNLGEIALFDNLEELGEVSVVAQRPIVRVAIDRITYSVQDDPEAATSSVLDVLRRVPLVTVDGEDNIHLRGGRNFRIHLNGRPSGMITSNPREVLRAMPASSVRDIEIITGPGARYEAEGIGGIINIITYQRADDGYMGSVGIWADNFGTLQPNAFLTLRRGNFGFTGNIFGGAHRTPESEWHQVREDFDLLPENTFTQGGTHNQRGRFLGGGAELTYEPDTLNLFRLRFNTFLFSRTLEDERNFESAGARNFIYRQESEAQDTWNSLSLNADYQRNFRRNREEKLTISYSWQGTPNQNSSSFSIPFVEGVDAPFLLNHRQRNRNTEHGHQHVGQIDYVNPLSERHVIEMGVKYIFRHNFSEGYSENFSESENIWQIMYNRTENLDHRQQIAAAYVGYRLRLDNFSFQAGVRAEHTSQHIENNDTAFSVHFPDVVPNVAVMYQIRPTTTLRFGYNKRIRRPTIWELNPFRNDTDPSNIHSGNPELRSQNSHTLSLTFSHFAQRFSINPALSYNFSNNLITSVRRVENDLIHTTFDNVGSMQNVSLGVWGSWTPIEQLRISLSGFVGYTYMQGDEEFGSNSGIQGHIFSNIAYTLPGEFRLSFNGSISSGGIDLQTTHGAMHSHAFSLSRSFFDRRLDVSVNAVNPFQRYFLISAETVGNGFTQSLRHEWPQRRFGISVSYRFGELQNTMRRVERSIVIDDVSGRDGGGGGGM